MPAPPLPAAADQRPVGTLALTLDDLDRWGRSEPTPALAALPHDVATWDRLDRAWRALDAQRGQLLDTLTIEQHLAIEEHRATARQAS
ncbi:hypothetical protein ACFL09_05915 [Planctomycetota bacterium]